MIWKLFLEQVLAPFCGQRLNFVLDNTPFRDDLTMVYLELLERGRLLPASHGSRGILCAGSQLGTVSAVVVHPLYARHERRADRALGGAHHSLHTRRPLPGRPGEGDDTGHAGVR